TDIAFYRPGSNWTTIPVLFANGDGSWTATDDPVPAWANQSGVVAVPGDFSGNGRTDIAFYRPGSNSSSMPALFSNGDGSWTPPPPGSPSRPSIPSPVPSPPTPPTAGPPTSPSTGPAPVGTPSRSCSPTAMGAGPRPTTRRRPGPISRASSPSRANSGVTPTSP